MPATDISDEHLATLDEVVKLAAALQPRDFVELIYTVMAEMADDGVSMEALAMVCGRISDRIAMPAGRRLH